MEVAELQAEIEGIKENKKVLAEVQKDRQEKPQYSQRYVFLVKDEASEAFETYRSWEGSCLSRATSSKFVVI